MFSILQAFIKRFLISNTSQRLLHFIRDIIPQATPNFNVSRSHILKLLEMHNENSDKITSAMKQWNSVCALPIKVIPKGIWPKERSSQIRVQTHIKSTLVDAVNLLKATGRALSTMDEKYLSLLLMHSCGWSATYPEHMDDPWVKFFYTRYPQLKNLTPILDSMTYPEELVDFPDGYIIEGPEFFLLTTSDSYFVYNARDGEDGLRPAGTTLEDVYNGMKNWRWADSSDDPWDFVEEEEWLSPMHYFPHYFRKENGNFGMAVWGRQCLKEYPGRQQNGLFNKIFRNQHIDRF